MRAIHKKDVGVNEWRNRHANLKADDPSDQEDGDESGSGDEDDDNEKTPGNREGKNAKQNKAKN